MFVGGRPQAATKILRLDDAQSAAALAAETLPNRAVAKNRACTRFCRAINPTTTIVTTMATTDGDMSTVSGEAAVPATTWMPRESHSG